ncbi:MAG: signal peptide peptidase SppA [candidate division Zixibacteria bacterium]|nr:signal peptide peptidase SppA [candidate division Zixibacteria bacterium]
MNPVGRLFPSPVKSGWLPVLSLLLLIFWVNGCTLFKINVIPGVTPLKEKTIAGEGDHKILVVDISGMISNQKAVNTLGVETKLGMVDRVREILKKAEEDDEIRGVLLRINTPGGTVTSSDIIYHEIKAFKRRRHIKVFAMVMDLAASGGYYIAQAADQIIAHPTSLTGSIGVIALKMNLRGLMDKVGVDFEVVKSGDKKDFLSPFRPLTEDERQIFQNTIDTLHERFVATIEEGRKNLSREEIKKLADGRIYTSRQALDLKLIDHIGYIEDVQSIIKKSLGLPTLRLITYHRTGQYKSNVYSMPATPPAVQFNLVNLNFIPKTPEPNFMYLWMP